MVKQLPIPPASPADKDRLSQLAEACAAAAQQGDDETLAVHEAEIDEIVYRLFDLTPDEIALIESALAPTRQSKPARKTKTGVMSHGSRVRNRSEAEMGGAQRSQSRGKSPETEHTSVSEKISAGSSATASSAKPSAPWLPGERFNVEGELPPAKKAKAASDAASRKPLPAHDKDELMSLLREVLGREGACDRPTLIQRCARSLGYKRTGGTVRLELENAIRTAIRRGLLRNTRGWLSLRPGGPADSCAEDRGAMKAQLLATLSQNGRVWIDRAEIPRRFALWFSYQHTSRPVQDAVVSLLRGLVREGKVERDGASAVRRM